MIPRRSSSGSGWPSNCGIDGSAMGIREESDKGCDNSTEGSDRSDAIFSDQSKNSTGKISTPLRTPGKEGRQISPDEISGEAPVVPSNSPLTESVLLATEDKYADPTVRPMGFRNGPAPKYPSSICYRNATITMLLNLPYFVNWLKGGYPSLREENAPRTTLDNMQKLAEVYWSQPNSLGHSASTSQAINVKAKQKQLDAEMDVLWNNFLAAKQEFTVIPQDTNHYDQEDAAEFLMRLFESFIDTIEFR
jgi:hypothetical protein